MAKKKVLTICGNGVRSGAMTSQLRFNGFDAVALSGTYNTPETFATLSGLADRIILMAPEFLTLVPAEFHPKVRVCDFGPDIWGNPLSQELLDKCLAWMSGGAGEL